MMDEIVYINNKCTYTGHLLGKITKNQIIYKKKLAVCPICMQIRIENTACSQIIAPTVHSIDHNNLIVSKE
jgi:hypothetical protein